MSHERFFKRGTVKCPNDDTYLHWEQIHGMRIVRMVGKHEVYQAKCPRCGKHWSVKK